MQLLLITTDASDNGIRQILAQPDRVEFHVHTAESLSSAFDQLAKNNFDVILLELPLPPFAGIEAFRQVRDCAPDTPTVVASSLDDEALALEAVKAGAQDYLVKSRINASALNRVLRYAIQRHRTEEDLVRERHLLSTVMEGVPDLVCFKDTESRFTRINRAQAEALGLSDPQEAVGKTDFDYFSPAYARAAIADDQAVMRTGEPMVGRLEKSKNARGETRWLLTTKMPLRDPRGRIAGTFGISRDVTELKQAEEEREKSAKDRLLILESTREGIYGIDLQGRLTFMNRSAAAMLRCDPEEVLGKDSHNLFHHSRADGSAYAVEQCPILYVLQTGEGCHVEDEPFWRSDGSKFSVSYSAHPVKENGVIAGAVVSFDDVTERKRMDIELRHAQKLEAVGSLAAGIAHEINTPIQFVGDNTRFLQDSFSGIQALLDKYQALYRAAEAAGLDPAMLAEVKKSEQDADLEYVQAEIPKALRQAMEGVERVAKIVRAMKEFSRVDHSNEQSPADLNRAIESTLIVARNEIKYVAEVETDFGELPPVICQIGDLNQVFLNLLVNAAHAIGDVVKGSGEKGKIRVQTRLVDDIVEVSISDSGTGIPESIRGNVFDPFFTTKEVGKGTGQGLAIARAIVVEKHGGKLTFTTEVGKGTTFYLRLPVNGLPAVREALSV